jgi:hypothetical protein
MRWELDWIDVAQDKDELLAAVNMVMKLLAT